jgi:succinate dehydrogenase/fumarate reductase flavoprotein subunit
VPALGAHSARDQLRAREAAAMVAHARWMFRAALARDESRGMHRREDHRASEPAWQRRLLVGGLDEVVTAAEPIAPALLTSEVPA